MAWRYDNCGGGYDTVGSGHGMRMAEIASSCLRRKAEG